MVAGGRVIHGTGNPWCHLNVRLGGDRIAGPVPPVSVVLPDAEKIDAAGML